MFVFGEGGGVRVLSGKALSVGLITRPEESFQVCVCVGVCGVCVCVVCVCGVCVWCVCVCVVCVCVWV